MAGKAFLDTNILLRSLNRQAQHSDRVRALVDQVGDEGFELWISRQVIREYLVQVTRVGVLDRALTQSEIEQQIADIKALFHIADETRAVTDKLLELLAAYPTGGKQIHDANIVATMLAYGIDTLLTLNYDDMKRFDDRITLRTLT